MSWRISDDERRRFDEDGYFLVDGLLSPDETRLLQLLSAADSDVKEDALARSDADGTTSLLTVRNELRDDVYSAITRSERIVHAMETVLGGEVYHYHHKLMLKQPR
ncbi:MAG: phytanoyl-CoA dioxygenase family protein, partial [Planctomycetes bacterium]|nr:phytanoyl-CoA dioxygenase family protein [Planctomycetota bacterium]